MTNFKSKVYHLVRKIPKGRVATYGQISKKLRINSRVVGWMLHANRSIDVPCHRVVDRNGRIAANFAFNGVQEQRRRLISEGIKFKGRLHVDLSKFLWKI